MYRCLSANLAAQVARVHVEEAGILVVLVASALTWILVLPMSKASICIGRAD